MQEVLKGAGAATQGALEALPIESIPSPLPPVEPEPKGYGTDVAIVIVGVLVLGSLYKFWLKYGKK